MLWHAQSVLREFRGDGHVAALLVAGVSGLQSIDPARRPGQIDGKFLRAPGAGAATVGRRDGGLRSAGCSTARSSADRGGAGAAGRDRGDTDRLAVPAYGILGDQGAARLAELARPLSRTIVKAGFLTGVAAEQ